VQWARKSHALNPRFTANMRFLTAGLAADGQADAAHKAAQENRLAGDCVEGN